MVKISNVVVVGQNIFIKYWLTTLINPLTGRTHNLMVLIYYVYERMGHNINY
jgi:hypothetical protein